MWCRSAPAMRRRRGHRAATAVAVLLGHGSNILYLVRSSWRHDRVWKYTCIAFLRRSKIHAGITIDIAGEPRRRTQQGGAGEEKPGGALCSPGGHSAPAGWGRAVADRFRRGAGKEKSGGELPLRALSPCWVGASCRRSIPTTYWWGRAVGELLGGGPACR